MLHLHRAERADGLVGALGDLLSEPLADPMEAEVVSVPTRGVERWVSQSLAARLGAGPGRDDGVCAHVRFPFPATVVGGAVAAASGIDPSTDPWPPERSVWPLLGLVDEAIGEGWLAPLAAHLRSGGDGAGHTGPGGRRFTTLRHVADLFDRYAVHRPELLLAWAGGADGDAAGGELAADAAWQPELWRRLRGRLATPSPAERLDGACRRLRHEPQVADLPGRISLFGLTRLPACYLEVLRALAAGRDVHLFLLHPSPALWEKVAATPRPGGMLPPRSGDATARAASNPLLASWGRDAREMQLVVAAGGDGSEVHHHRPMASGPPATLLQRVQADVRADRRPPGRPAPGRPDERPVLEPGDRSLQIHACHGRARQMEVVRDAVLQAMADDPSLEPRDVIVMCPDIETFAPLVHASFGGSGEAGGGPSEATDEVEGAGPGDLMVRLADRSLRRTNPVLGVVAELLSLAGDRVTASQVLDLAGREPVRRRFHLDDDDLARLEEWAAAARICWGLDAGHRRAYQLEQVASNTWRAGLDRLLVGVAMADEDQRLVGGVVPLDDVDSAAIDLVGRLVELVDRLGASLSGLTGCRPLVDWAAALSRAADMLTAATGPQAWQRIQLQGILDEAVREAGAAGPGAPALDLSEVRALLADRLRGRPTSANFRTGHLTVCTLVPMRSVPHRVVCLVGLDDGAFPRQTAPDGDDLVLAAPRVGDREARAEDRQLLLDALLAATDTLVVTYTGRDERTNAARPPAVPVGELLDVVEATVRAPSDPATARSEVVVHHPLQPFDPRNFIHGALVPGRPWSFDGAALAGARALTSPRSAPPPFLAGPLPAPPPGPVEVEDLVRFVRHPVRAFLRQRLGISLFDRADQLAESIPLELDALERWEVGQRLLEARLGGAPAEDCVAAERARGTLPPGRLADGLLDSLTTTVECLVAATAALTDQPGPAVSVEVEVELPDGRVLVGTVAGIVGQQLRSVTFSRVGPRPRLVAWARFLALTAARPEWSGQALTLGRARSGAPAGSTVTAARLPAPPGGTAQRRRWALDRLAELVGLYDAGQLEPLPLYCMTSAAHAAAVAASRDPLSAARSAWETSDPNLPREDRDPSHLLVLGGVRGFDGGSRFAELAGALWEPLLAWEQVADS